MILSNKRNVWWEFGLLWRFIQAVLVSQETLQLYVPKLPNWALGLSCQDDIFNFHCHIDIVMVLLLLLQGMEKVPASGSFYCSTTCTRSNPTFTDRSNRSRTIGGPRTRPVSSSELKSLSNLRSQTAKSSLQHVRSLPVLDEKKPLWEDAESKNRIRM